MLKLNQHPSFQCYILPTRWGWDRLLYIWHHQFNANIRQTVFITAWSQNTCFWEFSLSSITSFIHLMLTSIRVLSVFAFCRLNLLSYLFLSVFHLLLYVIHLAFSFSVYHSPYHVSISFFINDLYFFSFCLLFFTLFTLLGLSNWN